MRTDSLFKADLLNGIDLMTQAPGQQYGAHAEVAVVPV